MAGKRRSSDTIAALLGNAPGLAPVPADDRLAPDDGAVSDRPPARAQSAAAGTPGEPPASGPAAAAAAEPVRPDHLRAVAGHSLPSPTGRGTPSAAAPAAPPDPDAGEWDDPAELERFEFDAAAPIVKPRRRRDPIYQTLRINSPTARIMRLQWQAARRIDPMVTFTEFATVVCQRGLRALKEDRERDE
jgi:hypothetical protein